MSKQRLSAEQKASAFNKMGNLAFYSRFNNEFFYFNYLLSNAPVPPYTDEFNAQAHKIGASAVSNLNKGSFLAMNETDDQTASLKKFQSLLNVIDDAIIYERSNELAYFQQKYNTFLQTFSRDDINKNKTLQDLETILQASASDEGEFDYKRLMALINIILQGYENANAVVQYEAKHLKEIDAAMEALYGKKESQLEGLAYIKGISGDKAKKMFQRNAERTARHVRVHYLEQGNLDSITRKTRNGETKVLTIRGVKTHFKGIMSSDVKLAHWINDRIQKVLESEELFSQIKQLVLDNNCLITGNYSCINNKVVQTIIRLVQQEAINRFPEILADKYKRLTAENLIKQMDLNKLLATTQTYGIDGLYTNYAMYGRTLDFFKQDEELENMARDKARELFNALREAINAINRAKRKKQKISEDATMVKEALEQADVYTELENLKKMFYHLERLVGAYKSALANIERFQAKYDSEREYKFKDSTGKEIIVTIVVTEDGQIELHGQNGRSWKEELAQSQEYQDLLGDKLFDTDNLKSYVSVMKARASQHINNILVDILTDETSDYSYREELRDALANTLQRTRVSVGGPKLSELLTAMQFKTSRGETYVEWTGSKNSKNDVVTIKLNCPDGSEFHSVADILDVSIPQKALNQTEQKLDQLRTTVTSEFVKKFQEEARKLNTNKSDYTRDERLHKYAVLRDLFIKRREQLDEEHVKLQLEMEKTHEAMNELRQMYGHASDEKKMQLEERMKKTWVAALYNSFYVSTTVKTYNQYQNNIGFIGGSLGSNVYEQITRLSDIFNSTGIESLQMSKGDINWLIGAVINCSPVSVIGDKHKNIIEHYLGSMAAFALFDEGGAEVQLLHMQNEVKKPVNPNILHLYKVNGIFVPGSYVLTEVKKELEYCIQQVALFSETANRGAGVTIINSMNYDVLPNRNRILTDTNPWGTVSRAADQRVSIKILFLAGLKQIVNNINQAMGNIELPQ